MLIGLGNNARLLGGKLTLKQTRFNSFFTPFLLCYWFFRWKINPMYILYAQKSKARLGYSCSGYGFNKWSFANFFFFFLPINKKVFFCLFLSKQFSAFSNMFITDLRQHIKKTKNYVNASPLWDDSTMLHLNTFQRCTIKNDSKSVLLCVRSMILQIFLQTEKGTFNDCGCDALIFPAS